MLSPRPGLRSTPHVSDSRAWSGAQLAHRAGLERLARYILRPPFAQERLRLRSDGRIALELKTAWHDGTRELVFEPLEFLERLAAMTPRPETNLLICHGLLAPRARWRERVVAYGRVAARAHGLAGAAGPRPRRHRGDAHAARLELGGPHAPRSCSGRRCSGSSRSSSDASTLSPWGGIAEINPILHSWVNITFRLGNSGRCLAYVSEKQGRERRTGNPFAPFEVAGAGDGLTANLHGHEAGNGGYSQGEPAGHRASPRPYYALGEKRGCFEPRAKFSHQELDLEERGTPTVPLRRSATESRSC